MSRRYGHGKRYIDDDFSHSETGGRIVAATFARMLAYDRDSILYGPTFTPTLGSTLAELLETAGVL